MPRCKNCHHAIINGAPIDCSHCGHHVRSTSREYFDRCFHALYTQKINARVSVAIGQLQIDGGHSQYLTLLIDQTEPKRWISLRLSTVRKIMKFLTKHGFDKARRLTEVERRRIDGDLRLRDRAALPVIDVLQRITKRRK